MLELAYCGHKTFQFHFDLFLTQNCSEVKKNLFVKRSNFLLLWLAAVKLSDSSYFFLFCFWRRKTLQRCRAKYNSRFAMGTLDKRKAEWHTSGHPNHQPNSNNTSGPCGSDYSRYWLIEILKTTNSDENRCVQPNLGLKCGFEIDQERKPKQIATDTCIVNQSRPFENALQMRL